MCGVEPHIRRRHSMRQFIPAVMLVACAATTAFASNERATFILTNGERATGAGGHPSAAELQKIPASGQVIVLRSGEAQPGSFVNLVHGDTLLWRNQSGQQ